MYGILSDFIYWLNCNILCFGDSNTIPQKSLFSQTFLWDLSFLLHDNGDNLHKKNYFGVLMLFLLIMEILPWDNVFLCLISIRELFAFSQSKLIFEI